MKKIAVIISLLINVWNTTYAQQYTPRIEPCPCMIKVDPALLTQCGYLVVPENRAQPNGRIVKVPFVFTRPKGYDANRNVMLISVGGPGYSTIDNFDTIPKEAGFFQYGAFLAFDQCGTSRSIPRLDCPEVEEAVRQSYRQQLSRDSLVAIAVTQCRNKYRKQGIDISAYNTIENAADINDLRKALKIDSLNLMGMSYSAGLMLTVARNHPQGIRCLILNSPLPGFVNYEEHASFNLEEALQQVFDNCTKDSATLPQYDNLQQRFRHYFTAVTGKEFHIRYAEKTKQNSLDIIYTKAELLKAIISRLNNKQIASAPSVINEIINGNHNAYVKEVLDATFAGDKRMSLGMRYSVYCAEQMLWTDQALMEKQTTVLPWLTGYVDNNVDQQICDCWKVNKGPAAAKTPVYSNIPTLIASGDADPWCRPFYAKTIKRYMPNAQAIIIHNTAHTPPLRVNGTDFLKTFLEHPYRKLPADVKDVIVER
ncbi:alpha/beta hydrolase [Chitinophaga pendula]|uniref:alpha/beta hydrolase n=1 Tax=Chitinophaga TaxID=79328 RepID=UPI000BAFA9B3|nr:MULTISPECIES: alpha/beta fold hydrolase [Chitinophaga]ASZ11839.1 alpha/beta hydrolase [Chitinophaga sp. MD30]UCJ05134.1 alpha/beta hydrolase [Chitinophaga pendula]